MLLMNHNPFLNTIIVRYNKEISIIYFNENKL